MALRCAILDDYQHVALRCADWGVLAPRVAVEVFADHLEDEARLAARLAPFDIVVAMRERTPFGASLLARLPALKLLVTTGMRNAAIDLPAAAARGITVCGTDGSPHGTPELTWALILGLARQLGTELATFRTGGPWQSTLGTELAGKTLGVIGLGNIGARVARVGLAFGMAVQAWSRNLTAARCAEAGVAQAASLMDLLGGSDVVTIHLKLGPASQGLIGAAELAGLKRGALLVNSARAEIVQEAPLLAALRSGALRGYGTDVFRAEPLPATHPFRSMPNVFATPHLGYVTEETYRLFHGGAVEAIRAWLDGTPIRVIAPG